MAQRQLNIRDHPARIAALEARLASAEARVEELELELARSVVEAPFEAIVSAVAVSAGDLVKRDQVLLQLYPVDGLEVRARIPAPYQAEVIAGMSADEPLRALADSGGATVELELVRAAGEADSSGIDGLFRVPAATALRVGQMVTVRLQRPSIDGVVAVPFAALYGGDRLYRLVDGRLDGVDVQTLGGQLDEAGAERLLVRADELRDGDLIVTTHLPNAVDGLRVERAQ